jgi:hypothetical protein
MCKALPLLCLLALVLAPAAEAKGPDRATLTGPGLEQRLVFHGYGPDGKAPLGVLTTAGGFWVQAFGAAAAGVDQGKVLASKPKGTSAPATWSSTASRARGGRACSARSCIRTPRRRSATCPGSASGRREPLLAAGTAWAPDSRRPWSERGCRPLVRALPAR